MALHITTRGEIGVIQPANGKSFTLEELQRYVDGYIQVVNIGGKAFVVNEEGLLRELPVNKAINRYFQGTEWENNVFVGDIVICKVEEID